MNKNTPRVTDRLAIHKNQPHIESATTVSDFLSLVASPPLIQRYYHPRLASG